MERVSSSVEGNLDGGDAEDDSGGSKRHCFVCWGSYQVKDIKKVVAFGGGRSGPLLRGQLGIVLLLRKVLGLEQEVLWRFLEETGDLGEWGILLCGRCSAVFEELEFVHRRMTKVQAEFAGLAKEMRGLMRESVEQERASGALRRDLSGDLRLSKGVKRRGPGRPPKKAKEVIGREMEGRRSVVDRLREAFFEGQRTETLDYSIPSVLFTCKGTGSLLDGAFTTHPISVKLPTGFANTAAAKSNEKKTHVHYFGASRIGNLTKQRSAKVVLEKMEFPESSTTPEATEEFDNFSDHEELPGPIENAECDTDFNEESQIPEKVAHAVHFLRPTIKCEMEEVEQADNDGADSDDALSDNEQGMSPEWVPEEDMYKPQKVKKSKEAPKNIDINSLPMPSAWASRKVVKKGSNFKTPDKMLNRNRIYRRNMAVSKENVNAATLEIMDDPVAQENGKFKCAECDKIFKKKLEARVHQLKDHYADPLPYHCHVCDGKRFYMEISLRRHMIRFHKDARHPYDQDFDPELHSAEKLKGFVGLVNNDGFAAIENKDDMESEPVNSELPEEILKQFKNDPHNRYPCRQCKRKFSSPMLRDAHEKRQHQGVENPYPCQSCHRSFKRRSELLRHVVIFHFSGQQICPQCGARFSDKIYLQGHIHRVHLGEKLPFICTIDECKRRFLRKNQLMVHVKKDHAGKRLLPSRSKVKVPKIYDPEERQDLLSCAICSREEKSVKFRKRREKDEHMEKVHNILKPCKCPAPNCNRRFGNKGSLSHHIACHHKHLLPKPEELICNECGKSFTKRCLFESHVKSHGESTFMCDLCGKKFKNQNNLDDHRKQMHHKELNVQPFKCKFCGKILGRARSLDHHIKLKHTKEAKFKCTEKDCDFGSMFEKGLQRHMEVKHLKVAEVLCHICSRSFPADHYLTRHMRIHTGEKPYKCKVCGKDFSDMPTYNRHVEAHKGRIHECPLDSCKKQYITRHAFRVHIKQHQQRGIDIEIPAFTYYDDDELTAMTEETSSQSSEQTQAESSSVSFGDVPPPLDKENGQDSWKNCSIEGVGESSATRLKSEEVHTDSNVPIHWGCNVEGMTEDEPPPVLQLQPSFILPNSSEFDEG